MNLYIVTREINDYNQDGEYFVAAFDHIPTKVELTAIGVDHFERIDNEDEWYNLRHTKTGDRL